MEPGGALRLEGRAPQPDGGDLTTTGDPAALVADPSRARELLGERAGPLACVPLSPRQVECIAFFWTI